MRSFKLNRTHIVRILALILAVIFIMSLFAGCTDFQIKRSLRIVRKTSIAYIKDTFGSRLDKDSITIGSVDVQDSGYTCIVYGSFSATDKYGLNASDMKFRITCKLIDGEWYVTSAGYPK